ncbi:hypothetical protein [uncultured Sphingomonas sp.]|uniref:hypothetical protein n=1 Tax=uncultured Sphingomonas sp. TaxID=158754 RepID=UPI003747EDB5
MSIIIMLMIIVLGWHAATATARLLVDLIATVMGVVLFAKAAQVRCRMLAMQGRSGDAGGDQRLSRSERRLLAAGLKLAMRQTEFRSLLPQVAARCERLVFS